jgi:CubicO group peptidase (beta-lactamase class C family)
MDECPDDPDKTEPGVCGCSVPEGDCCVAPQLSLNDDPNMETILNYVEANLITDGTGFDLGPDQFTLQVNDLDWARPTGATMSVVKDGELYAADAVGYTAKPGHPLRQEMDEETIIRIGSTSKLVTGAGASALRDQELVDFDEPISTYMPFLELTYGREDVITTRHLLNQTASMFHHYPMCGGSGGVAPYEEFTGSATDFWTEPPRLPIDYIGSDWNFLDGNNQVLYFDFRCPTTRANLALPGVHDEECYYTSADASQPIHDAMYSPAPNMVPHTDHPDNATWRYGNGNLLLAQAAMEGATDENFRALQQRNLFNRAGMCRTTYDGDTVVELGNFYQGYDFGWQANFNGMNTCNQGNGTDFEICSHTQDEGNLHGCGGAPGPANNWEGVTCHPPDIDPMTWDAMGGLFSTSVDMGLLAAALVKDYSSGTSSFDPEHNVILSGDKARDMMGATNATKVPIPQNYPQYANGQHYGFGTFIKTSTGYTFVQHGGGGPGNSHTFIMEPESQWAVDLSFNSWNIWNNQEQSVGKKRLVEIIIECYFSGYGHDVYDGVGNANGGQGTLVGFCTGTL